MYQINLAVLIGFLLCHWAADFTHLSRPFMLAAKRIGKPLTPIFCHSLIHGFLMSNVAGIVYGMNAAYIILAWVTLTHFLIDVWKGKMNVWFPSLLNPANVFHWWIFGIDQLLHILVIILLTINISQS